MKLSFVLVLSLVTIPVNAQVISQRVTPIDGHVNHGDWIIPAGVGGAVIHHQSVQPSKMLVDPENPNDSLSIPDNGGFFADGISSANARCRKRGFTRARAVNFISGGTYYTCVK